MNSNYFNRKLINSIADSFKKVLVTEGPTAQRNLEQFRANQAARRAERIARGQQIKQEKQERDRGRADMQAEFDAALEKEMATTLDKFEARKKVSQAWAQDADKQKRARELGFGKIGQSTSAEGAFNWRWDDQAARDEYDKEQDRKEIELYGGNPNTDSIEDAKAKFRNAQAAKQAQQAAPGGGSAQSVSSSESAATRQGRIAQRVGDLAFRSPRSADEAERLRRAREDVEAAHAEAAAEGRRLGYEDQASLYSGFEKRGFKAGGGDPEEYKEISKPTTTTPKSPTDNWSHTLSRGNQRGTGNNRFAPDPRSPDRFA